MDATQYRLVRGKDQNETGYVLIPLKISAHLIFQTRWNTVERESNFRRICRLFKHSGQCGHVPYKPRGDRSDTGAPPEIRVYHLARSDFAVPRSV